jgi:hypothetical protein
MQNLHLIRTYHPKGTNGKLYYNGVLQCHTIELPWLNNQRQISCIPEGLYLLKKRYSLKFGDHVVLTNVPNRSLILIHPANNASKELKGCIAPVTTLTAPGQGSTSRKACKALMQLLYPMLQTQSLYLKISSQ